MGRDGTGVEVRPASIRLTFTLDGRRHRETLTAGGRPLAPTAANLKHAHRVILEVRRAIAAGVFRFADFFPESKHAEPERQADAAASFGATADVWLAAQTDLTPATRDQYRLAIALWKRILGADTPIATLTHKQLVAAIGAHAWSSPKRFNNALIPLRRILAMEYAGARAVDNPMEGIGNRTVVRRLPDPLTLAERDRILADMAERFDERVLAYFRWQFATGMRPEETIALQWGDVDLASGVARIQRVRTFKGSERDGTKTHAERDVDLVPAALDALRTMQPHTRAKGADAPVFQNPVTGRPWHDERSQREHYWHPTLQRLRIRRRRAYATRHTWCTAALMAGVNPAYVAAQAGHSVQMLLQVYARWLPENDARRAERDRLAAALGGGMPPESPRADVQEDEGPGNPLSDNGKPGPGSGRRDWTRTKKTW
jgi:integrase